MFVPQPMRDDLAHHIRERFILKRRNRHPARSLRRTGARGNACGVDDKLQRKMRKNVGDDACLAMPAGNAFQQRPLLQRRLVVLRGKPMRGRYFGHAAEQAPFRPRADQELIAARDDERSPTPQRAGLFRRLARKNLLIAARTGRAIITERAQRAGRFFRGADRGAEIHQGLRTVARSGGAQQRVASC